MYKFTFLPFILTIIFLGGCATHLTKDDEAYLKATRELALERAAAENVAVNMTVNHNLETFVSKCIAKGWRSSRKECERLAFDSHHRAEAEAIRDREEARRIYR